MYYLNLIIKQKKISETVSFFVKFIVGACDFTVL